MDYSRSVFRTKVTANRLATPGTSARLNERSPHRDVEVNVKPITSSPVDLKNFVPQAYLKPNHVRMMSENIKSSNVGEDFGGNNSYFANDIT
jgi:hypothetical protein